MRTVCYLGPAGTFTERAARAMAPGAPLEPLGNVVEVARRVGAGGVHGVVPIENSVHGVVVPSLDSLVFAQERVFVVQEHVERISFTAWVLPAFDAARPVAVVVSHPHALAQCTRLVDELGCEVREAPSTSAACDAVVAAGDPQAVALGSPDAGDGRALRAWRVDVGDHPSAATRFYLLAPTLQADAEDDRCLVAAVPRHDRVGALSELLEPFREQQLNVSSLSVRPVRTNLGEYVFVLTVDAGTGDARVRTALSRGALDGARFRPLGSYVAAPVGPLVAPVTELPHFTTDPLADLDAAR